MWELKLAEEYYHNGLGFDIVSRYGGQALFLSTGHYHHHIGFNTWNGVGAPAPAENSVGLMSFVLVLPSEDERKKVVNQIRKLGSFVEEQAGKVFTEDPSGNRIVLKISQ